MARPNPKTQNRDSFPITKRVVIGRLEYSEYGETNPIQAALELIGKDASEHLTSDGLEYSTYQFPLPRTDKVFSVSISADTEEGN